ncbi:MAG: VWA domain-containing protein, partial [Mesorhizobium sp.]
ATATLASLLSAVAVFATGGLKALEARGRPEDRLLIEHLRSGRK